MEIYERVTAVQQQQQALETQITMEQIEIAKEVLENAGDFAEDVLDAYIKSNELEAERQYQQQMEIIDVVEYFFDNPLITTDVATGVVGLGSSVVGVAATAGIVSIPIAGQVTIGVISAACGVWGVGRLILTVCNNLSERG